MSEPLRVLLLGPGLDVRGGVSAVERLILERLRSRIDVRHVATMEEGSFPRKLNRFVRALLQLRRELAAPGPLLIHIHFASRGSMLRKFFLARMAMRATRPVILHAHGASFDRFFSGLPPPLQTIVKRVLAGADRLVVLSSQWRRFYTVSCAVPAGRAVVLSNPVELPATVPDRSGRQQVQFVFLGRIGPRKGAFDLLQAFGALSREIRARARLVFAGDGEVETLQRRAAVYGEAVTVLPWINSARRTELLNESDVFVLPSYSEGVPMAVLEAMAFGLPVIVSPVGGIPDVVSDGQEGMHVPAGDVGRLALHMENLVVDESRRLALGMQARRRARAFDAELYADSLLQLYRQVMDEKSAELGGTYEEGFA